MNMRTAGHAISAVRPGSFAASLGVLPGDVLLAISGEAVVDEIDYQFLSARQSVALSLLRGGEPVLLRGENRNGEGLGLDFAAPLMGPTRVCANRCIFCFVDQQPPGLRPSLLLKDDDWRLSLKHGQYVTLTNMDEAEFSRLVARRASPLYVSVHAADPLVRGHMLGRETAPILPWLRRLKEAGLRFHAQIVICPGVNDGAVLEETLAELAALWPAAQSVALVPVGLTRHRQGLYPLRCMTVDEARALLGSLHQKQQDYQARLGTRFAFAADELYCLAGADLPPYEDYEDFPQIENGVGLLRQLEEGYLFAHQDMPPLHPRSVLIPCGVSAAPFLEKLLSEHPVPGVSVRVMPVVNHFWGESVTVTGLLTGGDLMEALRGQSAEEVLISQTMLREGEEIFLDDMTLPELREKTGLVITPVPAGGEELLLALCGAEGVRE